MSHFDFPAEKALLVTGNDLVFSTPPSDLYTPVCTNRVLSFTLFPTCESDMSDNEFLWYAVQNAAFDVNLGRRVVSRHLHKTHPELSEQAPAMFAMSIPTSLADFLASISLEDMHRAVLLLLADSAQADELFDVHNMRSFLTPRVWQPLRSMLHVHEYDSSYGVVASVASYMLDLAVQQCDTENVWRIAIDTALYVPKGHQALTLLNDDVQKAMVLQSLQCDWNTYAYNHHVWHCALPAEKEAECNTSNIPRSRSVRVFAMNTMLRLLRNNKQGETWERVSAVRDCFISGSSLFSKLPEQVVEQVLVPLIILGDDEREEFLEHRLLDACE